MKIRILFLALLFSCFSWGQPIFTNPLTYSATIPASPYTAGQTVDPNLTVSGIGRGSGINGTSTANRYTANNWSTGALDPNDYFEFTLTPNSGYEINFVSFVYTGQLSSGTPSYSFRSSLDGFTSNIPTPTTTGTTISLSGSAYQNITSAITFRFYVYGMPAATTTYSINDFTFNGTVTSVAVCSTPLSQASVISSSGVTTTTANLSWTDGATTSGTLVSLRLASSTAANPVNNTNYTPTLNFSTATGANLINPTNVVVAKNNAETVTGITGLTPGTQYVATPYAYNGSGTNVCFNTSNPESISFYTLALEPTASPASLTCGASTLTSISLTYPAASTLTNATGYILLYREAATPTGMPVDGNFYAPGTIIGDSTVAAYLPVGSTGTTISGLNGGTVYYFALIPFGSYLSVPETLNYRITALRTNNCNTSPAPEINVRGIIAANPTIADGDTTPNSLDNTLYGTVVVGNSQDKIFRVENTGNANLIVSGMTMVGGNNTDFAVFTTGGTAIVFPLTMTPGSSYDFIIRFSPGAVGTRTTTLNIASNDADENPYDFVLQGTGTITSLVDINVKGNGQSIPNNSVFPQGTNWTAFPVTLQGASNDRVFTIENLGTTVLSLTGAPLIQISGTHASSFSVFTAPSNSIAGGGSTTFTIRFSPTTPGAKNATITIASNDPDENPYRFNISGTCQGTNNIYVTGAGYDVVKGSTTTSTTNLTNFGLVAVTTGIKQDTFVITNLSSGPRYFSTVSISGPDAAMFTVVSQPNNNAIGSGNSTSFTINFTPASAGVKNATVTFNTYTNSGLTAPDSVDPVYTFAISGEGIVYIPCSNNAVQTIVQQDFEVTPATPIWNYTSTTDGNLTVAGGTFNNGSGAVNGFIGARSLQFKGVGSSAVLRTAVLNFDPVDVSQYSNVNLTMRVGAFRASGSTQGLDVYDLIQVETSTDGGVNWSVESILSGYNNSRWNFTTTGVFNAYYTGTNTGITMDTRNGNAELTGTAGISTYNVKNLPQSSNLMIRITMLIDRDDELWALDNVKIEGQTRQSTIWNGTAWSAGFPTSSTKAIFDGDYTTTAAVNHGSIEACECEVRATRNVTIDSGYYFEIQSDIKNSGSLTVANNANLIQINDAASNLGNITYQRTANGVRGFDYVYWSSPVAGQLLNGIYASPTPGFIYRWNPLATNVNSPLSVGNWVTHSTAMDLGTGYIMRGSNIYSAPASNIGASFFGAPNNGVIPVTISRGNNTTLSTVGPGNGVNVSNLDDNWNLVGNPYPSSIRALDFLNANTDIQGFVYLWTHGNAPAIIQSPFYGWYLYNYTNTDYITYNGTGTTSGPTGFNGYIAGGQGFFVVMNDGSAGTGTINFKNNLRNKSFANNQFYKNSQLGETDRHRIWLDIVGPNSQVSRTLIGYVPEATIGLDRLYDAIKNTANEFNIYSIAEGQTLAIQGRAPFEDTDVVPVGVRIMNDGEYKIAIGAVDGLFSDDVQNIYLEDKLLGVVHDLRQNPYSFSATAGIINERFMLRYNNNALGIPDFENLESSIVASVKNRELTVTSYVENIQEIKVFDILGRDLFEAKSIENKNFTTSNVSISQQALILKIKLASGLVVTRKIVL